MPTTKIVINIAQETPYDVRIGDGILRTLGDYLRSINMNASKILILSDSNVSPLYMKVAKDTLISAGYDTCDIVISAGEQSKSIEVASEIWEAMASLGMTRDSAIVALGGGVVGDIAGFIGSTYMRGIPVIQAPTTLLSMVDSSVGGKTGVNLEAGKNMVGTFNQPVYVCADIDTLSTLDDREWMCGCAEIAKSAVIDSNDFFFWMLEYSENLFSREVDIVREAIKRSVVFKANVVAEDKTESKGVRECLNYGHTLAHAIEVIAGYGTFSHGAAVAEGMRFATFLGERLIGTDPDFAQAQGELLDSLGLTPLDWRADPYEILDVMKHDKKARNKQIRFVLCKDVSEWTIVSVDDEDVLSALKEYYS